MLKNIILYIIHTELNDATLNSDIDTASTSSVLWFIRTSYHMPKLLSKQKHKDIQSLIRKGLSERVICSRLGVSRKSVQNKRKTMRDAPPPFKGGRKQLLAPAAKRKCVRLYTSGECDTVSEVTTAISTELNKPISRYTVARALSVLGVTSKKKKKAALLSEKNRKSRLAFARKYRHWTTDDWRNVIFSDPRQKSIDICRTESSTVFGVQESA